MSSRATIKRTQPEHLIPHPLNAEIYGTEDVSDLVALIQEHGFREFRRILVTQGGVIVSGHRRHRAALECGLETVPIEVIDKDLTEEQIRKLLIDENATRAKSNEQIAREYVALLEIERAAASRRERAGKRHDPPANSPEGRTGESRDLAAAQVGWGYKKCQQAAEVVAAIDSGEEAETLRELLAERSVNAAYDYLIQLREGIASSDATKRNKTQQPRNSHATATQQQVVDTSDSEPWEAEGAEVATEAESQPVELPSGDRLDGLGRVIPDHLTEAFRFGDSAREAMRRLDQWFRFLEEISQQPGAVFLDVQFVRTQIANVRHTLRHAVPHTQCPDCLGSINNLCELCLGAGWINKSTLKVLTSEQLNRLEV